MSPYLPDVDHCAEPQRASGIVPDLDGMSSIQIEPRGARLRTIDVRAMDGRIESHTSTASGRGASDSNRK